MENEELDNIVVLNDEEGNEVQFEFLDLVELDNEEAKEMATEAFEKFVLGMSDGSVKYGESTTINKLNYIKVTSIRRNVCNKDYDIYRYEISYDFKCSDSSYCFVVEQEPDGQGG